MTADADMQLFRAAWIAPMTGGLVRDGAIVVQSEKVLAVGDVQLLQSQYRDASITDLGQSVILPGLINAHTHLELTHIKRPPQPGRFIDWLSALIQQLPPSQSAPPGLASSRPSGMKKGTGAISSSLCAGIAQCLRFGVTTVADITRDPALVRPILASSPLRAVSFGEVRAMAGRRDQIDPLLSLAMDRTHEKNLLGIGISPHAPYSVELPAYERCVKEARAHDLPLCTHLAETPDETPFLTDHTGPFRELWKSLPWDDRVPTFRGGPVRFAKHVGLLDIPALLAHVNYCDGDDLDLLARGRATVVYCPRTHAYFKHGPHRWRQMLQAGINVAVGTDSCASSPDLNLVDDLRLMHREARDVPSRDLWSMATTRPAAALNLADKIGALEPGLLADFIVFPARTNDPLRAILESRDLPTHVYIAGQLTIAA